MTPRKRTRLRLMQLMGLALAAVSVFLVAQPAQALSYVTINGEGSSWAGNAWADWVANAQNDGVTVNFTPNGSSVGRDDFARQTGAVFADSEIPFTGSASDPQDQSKPGFSYGMFPVVAGGTSFMYNLPIGGSRYTNLKLNMATIAGIFSGEITNWDASQIAQTNPGVSLPNHSIVVVVRSDGSGATAQFKLWMLRQYPTDYANLVAKTGDGTSTTASSYFPTGSLANFTAQSGSDGVTTYTTQNQYTIDYDEYSYAQQVGFPVAQVQNAAGYFTLPTADNVAVALTQAIIDNNPADPNYLSQDLSKVYTYKDPRTYTMSMYSYEIMPKQTNAVTTPAKGATLAWVDTQAVCEWQREMGSLGYSPLPMNLVLASFGQILQIPGIDSATKSSIQSTQKGVLQAGKNSCDNPTFRPGDSTSHNALIDTAPFPAGCNAACQAPWATAAAAQSSSGPTQQTSGKSAVTAPATTTPAQTNPAATAPAGGGAPTIAAKATTQTVCNHSTGVCTTEAAASTTKNVCNASTGVCTTENIADAALTGAKATPLTIAGITGWHGAQTLAVILILLTVAALVCAPAIAGAITRAGTRRRGGRA